MEFNKCYRCFRPLKSCYCKYIKPFDPGAKFIILMHPKEAYKQKTGTGRLTHLSLIDSEILIGINFTNNERLNELISDDKYFPVLLYPDENAWTAKSLAENSPVVSGKKLLIIVVDATWFFAKKMVKLSENLHELPKISFRSGYRSQFTFKQQPAEECLSTIESCYYLIKELQAAGIGTDANPESLMEVFKRMVDFQLESEKERLEAGIPNRYNRVGKKKPKNARHPD